VKVADLFCFSRACGHPYCALSCWVTLPWHFSNRCGCQLFHETARAHMVVQYVCSHVCGIRLQPARCTLLLLSSHNRPVSGAQLIRHMEAVCQRQVATGSSCGVASMWSCCRSCLCA